MRTWIIMRIAYICVLACARKGKLKLLFWKCENGVDNGENVWYNKRR